MVAPEDERLLHELVPGLVHALGNALFRVQGHLQLAKADEAVMAACSEAQDLVAILRILRDGNTSETPTGPLVTPLLGALRYRLAQGQVELTWQDPVPGLSAAALNLLARTVLLVGEELPPGFLGRLCLGFAGQVAQLDVEPQGSQLPFPIDLRPIERRLPGATLGFQASGLSLELPDTAPSPSPETH